MATQGQNAVYYYPTLPHNTTIAFWDRSNQVWRPFILDYPAADWIPHGDALLKPGSGVLLYNPSSDPITVLLEGVHIPGPVTNHIPAGWSVVCSINAYGGSPEELGFPVNSNIVIRRIVDGQWIEYYPTNVATGSPPPLSSGWYPETPHLAPGEAFMVYTPTAVDWIQEGFKGIWVEPREGPWLSASRSNDVVTVTGHDLGSNQVWTLLATTNWLNWQSVRVFTNTANDEVVWQGTATGQRYFRLQRD